MNIQDLQPSDVLLFSYVPGDKLSEAIMYLTGCGISHAAMAYRVNGKIIEEVGAEGTDPGGVEIGDASVRFSGRTITVRRSTRAGGNFLKVLDAADKYYEIGEPFGMTNLVMAGLLLIYKKLPHLASPIFGDVVMNLLKAIAQKLELAMDQKKYPGKQPMFCSQFVFQCFQDAGASCALTIKDGLLEGDALGVRHPAKSLLEQALAGGAQPQAGITLMNSPVASDASPAIEDLLEKLVEQLSAAPLPVNGAITSAPGLLAAVAAFGETLKRALGADAGLSGLSVLKAQQACFVTPADLYEHCPDLQTLGTIPDATQAPAAAKEMATQQG